MALSLSPPARRTRSGAVHVFVTALVPCISFPSLRSLVVDGLHADIPLERAILGTSIVAAAGGFRLSRHFESAAPLAGIVGLALIATCVAQTVPMFWGLQLFQCAVSFALVGLVHRVAKTDVAELAVAVLASVGFGLPVGALLTKCGPAWGYGVAAAVATMLSSLLATRASTEI